MLAMPTTETSCDVAHLAGFTARESPPCHLFLFTDDYLAQARRSERMRDGRPCHFI